MRWVFAISLLLGLLAMIAWVVMARTGANQARAIRPRQAIAAAVAFGMGGLSASYGGWDLALAALAGIGAAALAAWYAGRSGPGGGEGRG